MDAGRVPYTETFAERLAKMNEPPKLDVQVCDHCNLRCAGCLHFAPLADKRFLDLDTYRHDLERLASVDGVAGYFGSVVLMGGEPLLHPQIDQVVRITRERLAGTPIGLCTNGLLLRRMDEGFWGTLAECDVELGISPYPLNVDYAGLADLARSKGVRVFLTNDITRTCEGKQAFMHLALDPDGGCDPAQSFTSCPFGGRFLQLARGAIWSCQVAAHGGAFAQRFGYGMHDEAGDSLPLNAIGSVDDIEAFRRRSHPMCRHCDNSKLTVVPWKRSTLSASEWLA